MWEISENLHRAELTVVQRSEQVSRWVELADKLAQLGQVSRWVELSDKVLAQLEPKPQGGRPESGDRKAARELNLERKEVQRAMHIAERKRLYEDAHGKAKAIGARAANKAMGNDASDNLAVAFTADTAEKTGTSERAVQRDASRDDPVGFVVSLNLRRRHLSEGQRGWVASALANLAHGQKKADSPIGLSQGEAATMLNVGLNTVKRAAVVRDHGVPELQAKVARD